MPRTKHAFIGLVAIVVVFLGTLGVSLGGSLPSPSGTQSALAIQSEEQKPEVIIVRDTTREEARASLKERLKAFVGERGPVDGAGDAGGTTEAEPPLPEVEEVVAPKLILCDPGASVPQVSDWGPVMVGGEAGVRTIHTVALGADGLPTHTLRLPLLPAMTGMTSCLPNGPIAILLDGRIITPGEAVNAPGEGVVGYAIDGFPLLGLYEEGRIVTSADLDVCRGHTHTLIDQGTLVSLYHYHVTEDAPYTLGCFRGTPVIE